ncbi:MAG: 1,4-dihydroxy-2-naphthoyl-CoA hydrolase [Alphaproteobacteria bacterium MarineAlpha9_Bin4]|nr:esterase [Pelagibacterales bacterium]PPR26352.1 MAG: 1,4-dihydroxy-2-naphthoyl-CoA hydrolase [Alphaproteobacteria bacterium MarineAlpha9_Bin4]|tara:strand:- start:27 stop:443 length:417 start_codon:yes stop_codon:yes gene_type:complete
MIWKKNTNLENINTSLKNTMADFLNIKIIEISENTIVATMPVFEKTIQPFGILHGGASVVLAETIGSLASNLCLEENNFSVGLDINANHIKSVNNGYVTGITKPLHLGKSTHVWEIKIAQEDKMTCISRLTTAILRKK